MAPVPMSITSYDRGADSKPNQYISFNWKKLRVNIKKSVNLRKNFIRTKNKYKQDILQEVVP